ncbi:hypothetical protein J2T22_001573 [Pseudarthrobacter defluvii]|uniref:Pseudouridine synthase n=1 Tax=Pseudarthrobacter defluvii TaxID=410837 RepID=A0ABT9UFH4_9MICC|nr:hypothetical protein [Pseudarthrobacter defluvii]
MKAKPKNLEYVRKAYREAAGLGELKLIKATQLRVDGYPILQEGKVYVTKAGRSITPIGAKSSHTKVLDAGHSPS